MFFSYQTFVPHLHEGQSQEIVKKSKSLHEVLHEVFEKVLYSIVNLTMDEKQKSLGVQIRKGLHSFYFKKLHEVLHEGGSCDYNGI